VKSPELGTVLIEVEERVAVVTLDRPQEMNAWNGALSRDLDAALRWTAAEDGVAAVVITGAGRAFCAGADLGAGSETFAGDRDRGPADNSEARTPTVFPWDVPKPVIAAINGHAVGIGATYPLACDLRVMATTAKIGFVFSRRGQLPELASHAILPRVVGMSNAADLLLSGRPITGDEAAAIGLVTEAVPADEVVDNAVARAAELATLSAPLSMAISKRLLWDSIGVREMMATEQPLFNWVAAQADSVEGVASFLEKRDPAWSLSASTDFPTHLFGPRPR
jgi:enoyl-CoA hydratase/carnithine racemase